MPNTHKPGQSSILWVRNWDRWQTYHRAAPPWIKLHRKLLRDHEFVALSPAQRGELVCMWMLAADAGGSIPNDAELVKKLCQLPRKPNLKLYQLLGFFTKTRRHHVALETETEAETEAEAEAEAERGYQEEVVIDGREIFGWRR